jgi:Fe-S-cluster containining protein
VSVAGGPWYGDGLCFECQRSGNCCTGASGTVRVSDDEIEALARRLELPIHEFCAIYTRRLRGGDVSLREKRGGDCVFYDREARGCKVYEDRPRQCRTWPFWPSVLASEERWNEEARDCPGMNRGPRRTREEIEALLALD